MTRIKLNTRRASLLLSFVFILTLSNLPDAAEAAASGVEPSAPAAAQNGKIPVSGYFSVDPAQQGTTFQAAVVLDIPRELHVNSNKPLGKFAIPTRVTVEAPRGFRVTPVTYPRGKVMTFPFAPNERLAVYEGQTVMRFNVTVPANHPVGVERVRVVVNYQSCNDEVCFPPQKAELSLAIAVVDRNTPMNRVNTRLFGGGRRRG
jgi:DsbC/DsbD-like thiol-disulfide interchange protein